MNATRSRDDAWLRAFAARPRVAVPATEHWDPSPLPPEAVAAATLVWSRRVRTETESVHVARDLLRAAQDVGAGDAVTLAAGRLERDEQSHVDLARAMLVRLQPGAVVACEDPPPLGGAGAERYARLVLTGLFLCEAVSAARFRRVLAHADMDIPRACIRLFLKDEQQHAHLGRILLPGALSALREARGAEADAWLEDELRSTFVFLFTRVAGGLRVRDIPQVERAQPRPNPGVVEPAVDARALHHVMTHRLVPALDALGLRATSAWHAVAG